MLQEINRALILMAFALTAQGQSPDSLLGQLEREVNIEAGGGRAAGAGAGGQRRNALRFQGPAPAHAHELSRA